MADPKIPPEKLSSQGEVSQRVANTDEKITDVAADYRGRGATPEEKADDNKPWISKGNTLANDENLNKDEPSRPQPDIYAQELNRRLGPVASLMDTIADGVETAMKKECEKTSKKAFGVEAESRDLLKGITMADPKIPEHKLFKQGQVFGRAATTDEKLQDIAPDYRGHGATPEEKADENKSWISEGHTLANVDDQNKDESGRPQSDTYAQEVNKRLGPLASVKDTILDGLESATGKVSGSNKSASESAGETKNSATGMLSQYTHAAWDKINEMKPTFGTNEVPKQDESALSQKMAEISEKGQHDANAIADKAKDKTSSMPDMKTHILDAGGDDVLKILADGGSTQNDPLKANMRVATEML